MSLSQNLVSLTRSTGNIFYSSVKAVYSLGSIGFGLTTSAIHLGANGAYYATIASGYAGATLAVAEGITYATTGKSLVKYLTSEISTEAMQNIISDSADKFIDLYSGIDPIFSSSFSQDASSSHLYKSTQEMAASAWNYTSSAVSSAWDNKEEMAASAWNYTSSTILDALEGKANSVILSGGLTTSIASIAIPYLAVTYPVATAVATAGVTAAAGIYFYKDQITETAHDLACATPLAGNVLNCEANDLEG